MTIVGQPFFDIEVDSTGGPIASDTSWSGARFSLQGGLERLPRPVGATAFMFPRAISRGRDGVEVVWSEPDHTGSSATIRGKYSLRAATWDGHRWSAVVTVGRFRAFTDLTRQMGSDLTRAGARAFLAFATEDSATGNDHLVLAQRDADGWTKRADSLKLHSIGAVALGAVRGALSGLVLGVPPRETLVPGAATFESAWYIAFDGRGWSAPIAVGGDGGAPVREPQLLTSNDQLIAAWVRFASVPTLEWRSIGRNGALGTLQRIVGVQTIVAGLDGHRDLLSVVMVGGAGRALRLRADGYDEVGHYPARLGLASQIGGPPDQPLAFVIDTTTRAGRTWPTLTAYSLYCEPFDGRPSPRR